MVILAGVRLREPLEPESQVRLPELQKAWLPVRHWPGLQEWQTQGLLGSRAGPVRWEGDREHLVAFRRASDVRPAFRPSAGDSASGAFL